LELKLRKRSLGQKENAFRLICMARGLEKCLHIELSQLNALEILALALRNITAHTCLAEFQDSPALLVGQLTSAISAAPPAAPFAFLSLELRFSSYSEKPLVRSPQDLAVPTP
jgi:hypothetical protein